jgi:HTH-type transcriptional regulator/antitoxin HigA
MNIDYADMNIDRDCQTPGHLIEKLINEREWNQKLVATMIGVSESIVSKMVSGVRPVDAPMAILLGDLFGVEPMRFLHLQQKYDLAHAKLVTQSDPMRALRAKLFSELPIKDMIRRGWIRAKNLQDVEGIEKGLKKFFNVQTLDAIPLITHAASKTISDTEARGHQEAWLYRTKEIASEQLAGEYSELTVRRAIKELEGLLCVVDGLKRIPKILAEAGIRYVVSETIGSAKIDGACFWLNESSPVIGMTLRYDRIDNFWFVLRHELEHVLRRHGMEHGIIDAELEGDRASVNADIPEQERQANEAAANFGVPDKHVRYFARVKSPFIKENDVLGFANTAKVHPGIAVGRLQFVTKRYDLFRHHLVKVRAKIASTAIVDGWGETYPIEW